MIGYDSNRGGVSVVTEKGIESSSSLLIQNARPADSGKYVCRPDNAEPATVNVHVLNGKFDPFCYSHVVVCRLFFPSAFRMRQKQNEFVGCEKVYGPA